MAKMIEVERSEIAEDGCYHIALKIRDPDAVRQLKGQLYRKPETWEILNEFVHNLWDEIEKAEGTLAA